jgi:hypothetical protein
MDGMTPLVGSHKPVHPLAWAALAMGLVASALALYGSFLSEKHLPGSPLNTARNDPGLESVRASGGERYALEAAAYFVPFVLGNGAGLVGGWAMRRIERSAPVYSGSRHAVFAIMIGGLSAVVSGCMILAVFVWKYVPTAYTY